MKIVFLNDHVYEYAVGAKNATGGLERNIWILSRILATAGWIVQVGVRGVLREKERKIIEGVEYIGVGQGPSRYGKVLAEWYRFLSSERPDWLFWAGASHLWGPLVEIARVLGVGTIFHTCVDADAQPSRGVFPRSGLWPLYAWGLWRTDRIFVQHTGQLHMLHARLRSKSCILPKIGLFPAAVTPHARRKKYVAWVGMLREHKRPDHLVAIAREAPDTQFVVCGGVTEYQTRSGYGERVIEALNKLPNVDCRGRVAPQEAEEVIANAAMLLCTSDEEGFPNTFMQAWASGTPVVTMKVDPDKIIETEGLGRVSGTTEQSIGVIRELMDSVELRQEMGEKAWRYVSEHHGVAAVLEIFTDTLNGRRRSDEHNRGLLSGDMKL